MVTFSIIIPVYNAAHTIRRCVESIEKNTFKDIEVILIEDGSADNSADICMQLASEYDNISLLINDCNHGVSYTRNRGLDKVSGKYTMFADSDDWLDPDYYDTFYQNLEQFGNALYICGFINHDEKHNKRTDGYLWDASVDETKNAEDIELHSNLHALYEKTLLQQLWNKVFITDVIKGYNIRFDEAISIGEDFRFILEYLKCAGLNKAVMINRPLYHYMRDQDGSLMYHVGYESVDESLKNLKCLYELEGLPPNEINEAVKKDRQHQIELNAYLIMHNAGMKMREKKRLIMALDQMQGSILYKKNRLVYLKEKIALIVYRHG